MSGDMELAGAVESLSGMSVQEIAAVNVVLHCFLCHRFSECETARQLVEQPLSLLEEVRVSVPQFVES